MSAEHPSSPRLGRRGLLLLAGAVLVVAAVMAGLWPSGPAGNPAAGSSPDVRYRATVTAVEHAPCPAFDPNDPAYEGMTQAQLPTDCGTATITLTDGPDKGGQATVQLPSGAGAPTAIEAGDVITVRYDPESLGGQAYTIIDHERGRGLWLLVGALLVAVVAFGRWRGLASLAGLAVTFTVMLGFIVPAILHGRSPLPVAVVGAAAITLIVLYLTHGPTTTTTVAVAGTITALTLTGLLAAVATGLTALTGVADEDSLYLAIRYGQVNMHGLLIAGIIIGALGVLDDITVTQATTVDELARANPTLGVGGLYRAAARVGRAHIASVINTIILAYAGASLPILLLIADADQPLGQVLTNPDVATEIVRSIVGTLGLIAAVPITTILAAFIAHRRIVRAAKPVQPRIEDDDAVLEALAGPGPSWGDG
jgi:uncharacterized membrane protein